MHRVIEGLSPARPLLLRKERGLAVDVMADEGGSGFPMAQAKFDLEGRGLHGGVRRVGVVCSYVPEEIIYAAGLQPVRLSGSGQPVRTADSYLHNNLCPHVRGLFDQNLAGELGDCEGIVFVNACDAMRRLHDVWTEYGQHGFVYFLDLLRIQDEDAVAYYADQLRQLAKALGEYFGTAVTDDSLRAAVGAVNGTRRLVAELHELRASVPPVITGSEAFPILLAGMRSDSAVFSRSTRTFLNRAAAAQVDERHRGKPRLLITGSVLHQPQIIGLVEEAGAVVVVEDMCVGHRHYDGDVGEEADLYMGIARRYVMRVACARMKELSRRHAYLRRLVEEFKVDGVIYHALKFCDLYQYDFPPIKELMEESGVPVLYLESDYTTGSYGQMKTRLQAFVEVLG